MKLATVTQAGSEAAGASRVGTVVGSALATNTEMGDRRTLLALVVLRCTVGVLALLSPPAPLIGTYVTY